jgi:hypothetical protein
MASGGRDRQARMDQRDRPDRTEPALANEPTESTEASEPAEPIDRIEPADPTDKIDPAEPMDKMDPLDPMLRIEPAEPVSRRAQSPFRMRPFSQPGPEPCGPEPLSARVSSKTWCAGVFSPNLHCYRVSICALTWGFA